MDWQDAGSRVREFTRVKIIKQKKNDNLTETNHYAPAKVNTTPAGWASKAAQCPHAPSPSAL